MNTTSITVAAVLLGSTFASLSAQITLPPGGDPNPAYPNLWAWFDAANGVNASPTPLADGTALTRWDDRSGNARDLTRLDVDPNRVPVVADNDASCGTAVRFDGNDYIWAAVGDTFGRLIGDRTIFVVVEVDIADRGYVFDGATGSGRSTLHAGETANPGLWHIFSGDTTQPLPNGALTVGTPVDESRYQIHAIVMQPNLQEHHIDFLLATTDTHPSVFNLGGLILGARVNTALGLSGHIKEVLIYAEALSTNDRQLIEGYLSIRHSGPYTTNYGTACAGTGGLFPRLRSIGCPSYGSTFEIRLNDANVSSPTVLLFGFGQGGVPIGACSFLLNTFAFDATGNTDANGVFSLPIPMPPTGGPLMINCQGFVIDPATPPLGLAMSNGIEFNIF